MKRKTVMQTGWHWVLALLMLLTQQAALRHSLHHDAHDEGPVAHSQCLSCLAFHAVDHAAAPSPTLTPPPAGAPSTPHVDTSRPHQPPVHTGFLARAPPTSLS